MKLLNHVESYLPPIPDGLKGKLVFSATYPISKEDAEKYGLALMYLVKKLEEDGIEKVTNVNAIFTEYGKVTIQMYDEVAGNHLSLAIYAVKKWKDRNFSDLQKILVFLEELCHHYWMEEDEIRVKYIVFDIAKNIFPQFTDIHQVYNLDKV